MTAHDTSRLTMRRDFFANPVALAAYAALLLDVFGIDVRARDARAGTDHPWTPFAAFTDGGACVATLEATALPLWCDGAPDAATAIRSVATDPAWRGLGLFRTLAGQALAWCEARPGPVLLYTAEPAIYAGLGFEQLPQHAFVGAMPGAAASEPARPLDRVADFALLKRCLAGRAPVSNRCAMVGAPSLFLTMLGEERDLAIAHLPAWDAVIVYKEEDDALVLADVVAATIPPLPAILGALPRHHRWLKTLFPPDRLGWDGTPDEDDTGLMGRGALPAAMRRPFMLPPTAGF